MKTERFADEAFETISFDGIAIVAAHGDTEPHGTVFIRAGMDRHTRIGRDAPRPEDTREIAPQSQPAIVFEPKWMCRFAHDGYEPRRRIQTAHGGRDTGEFVSSTDRSAMSSCAWPCTTLPCIISVTGIGRDERLMR